MALFSHLCLLCAKEDNVEHEIKKLNTTMRNLVADYTLLNYNIDKCPKKICDTCFNFLLDVKQFRKKSKNVENMMMQLMRDKEKEIDLNKYKRKFNVTKDFNDPKKEENELTSKPPKRIKHEKAEVQATSSRNRTPERHESTKSYKEKRHASPKKNRDEEDKHAIERRHTISSVGRHRSHERMEEKSRYHGRRSRSHEPRKDYKKGESERDKATKSRASSNDEKDRRKTRSEKHEAERSNVKEKRSHDEKRTPSRELKQENLSDVLSSYDRHGFQLPITKYDHLKALELFLRDSKKFDEMLKILAPYMPKSVSEEYLKHLIVDYMEVVHSLVISEKMAFCFSNNRSNNEDEICWHRFPLTINMLKQLIGSKFQVVMHKWCSFKNLEDMKRSVDREITI